MKKNNLLIIALAASAFNLTGCVTATNPTGLVRVGTVPVNPSATGEAVRIAAKLGAMATIQQQPQTRECFLLAATAIGTAVLTGSTTPTDVSNCLAAATSDVLVTAAMAEALTLYRNYYGTLVTNKLAHASPYTVPVLAGLANGMKQAYDLTAVTP